MTQFAYYHTPNNTIAFQELPREDFTEEALENNRKAANDYVEWFDFKLIGIFNSEWSDSKWDHEYARLERYGFYTAERRAELDTED